MNSQKKIIELYIGNDFGIVPDTYCKLQAFIHSLTILI